MVRPFFLQRRGVHHHPRTKRWSFYTASPFLSSNSARAVAMPHPSRPSVPSSVSSAVNPHGKQVAFCNWSATACTHARFEACRKRLGWSSGSGAFGASLAAIRRAVYPIGFIRGAGMPPPSLSRRSGATASCRRVRARSAFVSVGPQTRRAGRAFCAGASNS